METKDFNSAKILIVEDDIDNRNSIEKILREGNINFKNIEYTDNSNDAKNLIDDFEPDIVLLDIKILNKPGGIDDSSHSVEVIEKVQLYNYQNTNKISIIIISNTVNDKALQDIIGSESKNIQNFLDKHQMSSDYDKFKQKLFKEIRKALEKELKEEKIDYSFVRRSALKKLKELNFELWKKIEEELLDEFERINDKNTNEHNISRNIINCTGQIVEMIVHFLEGDDINIYEFESTENDASMRQKLNVLSGRKFIDKDKVYEIINNAPPVSRKACEFAYRAYNLRNQASHTPQMDTRNANIFADARFTKWDAAIAINLLMPLIIEYTDILKKE